MNETFWMLYVEGGSSPNCRHFTLEAALKEAERLARNNLGRRVHILVSIGNAAVCQSPVYFSPPREILLAVNNANSKPSGHYDPSTGEYKD